MEDQRAVKTDLSTNVGFFLPDGSWLGGSNYLRNLLAAVSSLPDNIIAPVLFAGRHQPVNPSDFPGTEIVTTPMLDRKSMAWFARKIIGSTLGQDILLGGLLRRHNISALSHSFHLGRQSAVKTIGWIPDFQHLHLPEFFTADARTHLDRTFTSICVNCNKVIVSSECARVDLMNFSPEHAHKAELLRFVATPVPLAEAASLPDLERLYNFDGPYFLLPNQFWVHKNHRVVLSALRELKRQHKSFLVLATGSSKDYRNPSFFPSLMQYGAECGVLDRFRVLGQIPFDHLARLMRHAIAFINPSRFEGWSTSVEEAKSMGKQVVISDIAVHREQAPDRGFFFPPEDPEALAEALIAAYNGFDREMDLAMQAAARECFPARQREFGRAYLDIVKRALADHI